MHDHFWPNSKCCDFYTKLRRENFIIFNKKKMLCIGTYRLFMYYVSKWHLKICIEQIMINVLFSFLFARFFVIIVGGIIWKKKVHILKMSQNSHIIQIFYISWIKGHPWHFTMLQTSTFLTSQSHNQETFFFFFCKLHLWV